MEIENIAHGLEILVALLCFMALLPSSLNFKDLSKVYLLGSLLSFIVSKIYIFEGASYLVRDVVAWGNFVSISLVLSALFVIIRDSKPVFARFPIYLTLLPLTGIVFFAIIPTSYAIKDILELIMQAGAVLVALLLFCVNTVLFEWKWTFIISILAFLFAYIIPIISFENAENESLLGAIFLCLGMIFLTISLVKYPTNIKKT
tara:strand:+ start:1760 stop:2368 length:609 start_codon:yes stop_codon:yes gene_type:complete